MKRVRKSITINDRPATCLQEEERKGNKSVRPAIEAVAESIRRLSNLEIVGGLVAAHGRHASKHVACRLVGFSQQQHQRTNHRQIPAGEEGGGGKKEKRKKIIRRAFFFLHLISVTGGKRADSRGPSRPGTA